IPTLRHLTVSREVLQERAERIAAGLQDSGLAVSVEPGISQVGGGSLPGEELPTTLVRIMPAEQSAGELARQLRLHEPPIFTRGLRGVSVEGQLVGPGAGTALHTESEGRAGARGAGDFG